MPTVRITARFRAWWRMRDAGACVKGVFDPLADGIVLARRCSAGRPHARHGRCSRPTRRPRRACRRRSATATGRRAAGRRGVLLPELRVLRPQFRSQLLPALVRLQRSCQDIPQPPRPHPPPRAPSHGRHEAQQTRYNPGITHPPSACRGPADTTPRQFHPEDFRLLTRPEQQHPGGCLLYTLDRVGNEKN